MSTSPPIACDLSAIPEDERAAHRARTETLFGKIMGVRELASGFGFRLPAETDVIQDAAAFISRERLCCPFFTFTLEVSPDEGPVWLKLSGRDGVKQYIEQNVLTHWDLSTPNDRR